MAIGPRFSEYVIVDNNCRVYGAFNLDCFLVRIRARSRKRALEKFLELNIGTPGGNYLAIAFQNQRFRIKERRAIVANIPALEDTTTPSLPGNRDKDRW
jgi:hypothetical protein